MTSGSMRTYRPVWSHPRLEGLLGLPVRGPISIRNVNDRFLLVIQRSYESVHCKFCYFNATLIWIGYLRAVSIRWQALMLIWHSLSIAFLPPTLSPRKPNQVASDISVGKKAPTTPVWSDQVQRVTMQSRPAVACQLMRINLIGAAAHFLIRY